MPYIGHTQSEVHQVPVQNVPILAHVPHGDHAALLGDAPDPVRAASDVVHQAFIGSVGGVLDVVTEGHLTGEVGDCIGATEPDQLEQRLVVP